MEPDKKGDMNLNFTFALDPHAYKKEQVMINKMVAAAAEKGKPITDPAKMKPVPKEFISVKTMSRAELPQSQMQRVVQNMIKNYREESWHTNEVIVKDLLSKYSLWANQAVDLLQMFKEEQQYQRMVEMIMPKVKDQHNKFKVLYHF